ncbi:MAG: hypothetical protein QW568_01800 [Candidatus Anstonellaceae archaeon]
MQGFAERKKEEKKAEEEEKKQLPASHVQLLSMSEGPMALKESQKVEQMGRASYEKSVKIELGELSGKKKGKKGKKVRRKKKIKIR